jgi:hypothetical protein
LGVWVRAQAEEVEKVVQVHFLVDLVFLPILLHNRFLL